MGRKRLLTRAWHGEAKLWEVWWFMGITVAFLTRVTLVLVAEVVMVIAERNDWTQPSKMLAGQLLLALHLVIFAAMCHMVWICAPNVKHRVWTFIARGLVVLALLSFVGELLRGLKG